jgi:acyl-CoA synthetase (NDP forming)
VRAPDVFRAAARRALAAGKAVVALKAGRSAVAARTAAAHTGALVGDDATVDAVFRDLGIIRVDTVEDLLVTAGAAARLGRLKHPGAGVVSISGGACDIIADLADAAGLALPELAPHTTATLADVMPAYGNVQNPLDVTGAAVLDPSLNTTCIEAIGNDPSIGVVLAVNRIPWQAHEDPFVGQPFVDAIGKGAAQSRAPVVFVNQVMQPITPTTQAVLRRGGVDFAICGLGQAVTAARGLGWWSMQHVPAPPTGAAVPVPGVERRRGEWSEQQARRLLEQAGVPVVPATLAQSADEAVAAAGDEPVALKLVSPHVLHKTDIGAVRLGVRGADDVRAAFDAVTAAAGRVPGASIEGVLVSPMRTGGVELLVGVARDPQWGPILAVALGGVFVELAPDAALAPLPVTRARARELLESLRGAAVFAGARGAPPANLDAVADVVARVADLAQALGEHLESLEINPLRVAGDVVEALDAAVTWRNPDGDARAHFPSPKPIDAHRHEEEQR